MLEIYPIYIIRICELVDYSRSDFDYKPVKNDLEAVDMVRDFDDRFGNYGFWLLIKWILREEITCNHNRIYIIY